MSEENWKLQVSYTVPNGPMINVRAQTSDELSVLLEGIGDYSTQVAAVQALIKAAFTVSPLETTASIVDTPPWATSVPAPTQAPSSTPTCIHGGRIFRQGVSKTNGKPYAFWACPTPQGTLDQCKPVN